MKHMSIKKVAVGVAAACLAVGTAAIAGNGLISIVGHGSSGSDYTKFEDLEKAEAEIGYSIDAVENFSNGFRFEGIGIIEQAAKNEAGEKLGERKQPTWNIPKERMNCLFMYLNRFRGKAKPLLIAWAGIKL